MLKYETNFKKFETNFKCNKPSLFKYATQGNTLDMEILPRKLEGGFCSYEGHAGRLVVSKH
jgi:hypothetical protein